MNIAPISYRTNVSMKADPAKQAAKPQQTDMIKRYPPAAFGVINGACWFGIGYAFDKVCKALFKTNSSNKTSLIVNGAIGLAMGAFTYFKAKQAQKIATKSA